MHLQSAHIQHYKSLEEVTVEFATPITVIVGPNGAGKSNLVDCLRFVRDAVVENLEHAVTKRGGFGRVGQHHSGDPFKVSISLAFLQTPDQPDPRPASYEVRLEPLGDSNYKVESERADYCWEDQRPIYDNEEIVEFESKFRPAKFSRDTTGHVVASELQDLPGALPPLTVHSDRLALGFAAWFGDVGGPLASFISDWRFSEIYPNTLKDLKAADKDTALKEDGSNWASVLRSLEKTSEGKQALARINEAMRAAVPDYRIASVSALGSYLVPQFSFEAEGRLVDFDPPQLSDGTLRIFGVLLALYHQMPPPGLLVIEEPEQSVHPGVLAVLVEAIREASELTQIILTTHSPQLVDLFKPEEIRVATMQDGRTHITPIAKNQIKAVKQRLMSLADFMQAEGLQPDLEP